MSDDDVKLKGDEAIVAQAKKRFARCEEWESDCHKRYKADVKFAYGDSDNLYQWPDVQLQARQAAKKPILTVNKVRQHCLQIVNDGKQQKPSITIRPTGDDGSYEAAQVFEGLVRHIEYQSNAPAIYDATANKQVQGGWGYWRFVTDYCDDDSFDQEIYMRPINDTLSCYLDPDIQEKDGSDARFAFVFEDMPREMFEALYKSDDDDGNAPTFGPQDDGWASKDHVRVCEYYRMSEKKDKLVLLDHPEDPEKSINGRLSDIPKEMRKAILADPQAKVRDIVTREVEWFKIAGDRIVERSIWPGKFIPIVRIIGEETVLDGKLDRRGHVRFLKDPQRIYNYHTSASVEFVALQSKSPWVAALESIDGLEAYWNNANTENRAYLPYNHYTENGQELPMPKRSDPPTASNAYETGMRIAETEMMAASGQYQAQLGQNENAKSGVAINARQRQGDNATYHFIDNLALGIRFSGRILIDLIPHVYDTPRIVKMLGEDGQEKDVKIDPNAPQSYQGPDEQAQRVEAIFNPNVGKYEVEADIGPAYATRRQEAFAAFQQIISQNHELMPVIGDLMFKAADFPMADKMAERLRRLVPQKALQDGPSPEIEQAKHQIEQLEAMLKEAQRALNDKSEQAIEGQFNAETRRLAVMKDMFTAQQDAELAAQTAAQASTPGLDGTSQSPQSAPAQEISAS